MYLMFASCSADEPVAQNTSDGVISYTVAAANQSRAAHSYCANNMPEQFKVWATSNATGKNYIDGDVIKRGPGGIYSDDTGIRYWPESGSLSFYAVVDDDVAEVDVTAGKTEFDFASRKVKNYTIPTDVSRQPDLMYAVAKDVSYNETNGGKVHLNFRHALSQICFKARNENPKSVITIKSITLCDIVTNGDYTLPSESTTGQINDHGETSANISPSSHGSWSLGTDESNYSIDITDGKVSGDYYKYLDVDLSAANDHTSSDWYAKVLNLIPQSKATTFTLSVKVENIDGDGSLELVKDDIPVNVSVDIDWKEGNRYIYAFNFPKDWLTDGLNDIKYTVTTDDFNEKDPYKIIDGHEAVMMREDPALYFATSNIGATAPENAGNYYWYGGTEGHVAVPNGNTYADDESFNATNDKIITIGKTKAELQNMGWLDNKGNLNPEYDAAYKAWGGSWRMPTNEDFEWLINADNCEWTAEKDATDKTIGFKVKSKTTGGEIYLPLASCFQEGKFAGENNNRFINDAYYWSSTIIDDTEKRHAIRLCVKSDLSVRNVKGTGLRDNGFPIRPVSKGEITVPVPGN